MKMSGMKKKLAAFNPNWAFDGIKPQTAHKRDVASIQEEGTSFHLRNTPLFTSKSTVFCPKRHHGTEDKRRGQPLNNRVVPPGTADSTYVKKHPKDGTHSTPQQTIYLRSRGKLRQSCGLFHLKLNRKTRHPVAKKVVSLHPL